MKRNILMFVILSTLFTLSACGGAEAPPTATPIPPPPEPTSVPSTATSTPIPPTAAPTPIIAQPDAIFAGLMKISKAGDGASAESGEIEFTTSGDGTAILSLSVSLFEMSCAYEYDYTFAGVRQSGSGTETAASGVLSSGGTFPITDGKFTLDVPGMQVTGHITSLTEANGTISISQEIHLPPNTKIICDYGTWTWDANIQ